MTTTLRALVKPRRLLPVVVVTAAMAATEAVSTGSAAAVGIDLLLCLVFWLVAPASWRIWCAPTEGRTGRALVLGHLAYLVSSTIVVAALGFVLPAVAGLPATYVTELPSLGIVLVLWLVGGWGLGRDIDLELGFFTELRRAERLALEAERAQLLALRSHLDPHFLFNTLNAIAEWCREDPETAEAATVRLATLLRLVLAGVKTPAWPLAREVELITLLFELYAVRDPQRFTFEVRVAQGARDVLVPPMVLLPLAENAIKHGPAAGHRGSVALDVEADTDHVQVMISNPGAFEGRRAGGEGIDMVEKLLDLAYDGRARMTIEARGDTTLARLELPRELRPPEASG